MQEHESWDRIMAAFNAGEVACWVARCRKHLERWTDEPGPWLMLAHGLASVGRYRPARRIFRELRGQMEELRCEFLGEMNETRGRLRAATHWWRRAASLQPHKTRLLLDLGRVYFRRGKWTRARRFFELALPDPETAGRAHLWLGQMARALERWEEAAGHFQAAGETAGARDGLEDTLAAAEFRGVADIEEVLSEYGPASTMVKARSFLERHRDPDVSCALGAALVVLGRFRPALKVYWALGRELGPGHPVCCTELGLLYHAKGRYQEAIRWFERLATMEAHKAGTWVFMGSSLARRGSLRRAEECHRRASECPEGNIDEAWLNLGLVLRARERLPEARDCFRKALQLDPGYRQAQVGLHDVERALEVWT